MLNTVIYLWFICLRQIDELYEKTDLLLGLGNIGGITRNNGCYTVKEELIALGKEI